MKHKLFLSLALLSCLLTAPFARADEEPQLFGSQQGAFDLWSSWKGNLLIVDNDSNTGFQIWDIASKRSLWTSKNYVLTMSRDEKTVMVAQSQQPLNDAGLLYLQGVTFKLLDARTGHLIRRMQMLHPSNDSDQLLEYGFTPDGSEFILATQDYLRRYNVRTGTVRLAKKWSGLKTNTPLIGAALTYDKKRFVAFDDGLVILDAATGAVIRRLPPPKPNEADVPPDSLEVSPDNTLVVEQFRQQNNSRIYRLSDGKLLWRTSDWPTFSLDGQIAYVPSETGLNVLDAHTGHKIKELSGPDEYGFDPSPDGNWLYETHDGQIYRWPTHDAFPDGTVTALKRIPSQARNILLVAKNRPFWTVSSG